MRNIASTGLFLVLAVGASAARAESPPTPASTVTGTTAGSPSSPLALEELVTIALERNAQIGISQAQIAQAEGLYSQAAAQAYPTARVTGLFGGPTPEAKTTVLDDVRSITPASREGDLEFGQLGIQLRLSAEAFQPLYTFDKISSLKSAASHLVQAAEHQKTVTEADVVVNVNKAFWTIQLTRTFEHSLNEGMANLDKVLVKIEELLENDSPQVTENDRLRLKYALASLGVRLTEAKAAREVASQAMRLLIGWRQERPLEVEPRDLDELPKTLPKLEELAVWARYYRPELKALTEVVEAADSFREFRKASFYPDIFIGGLLSTVYTSNATNQTNPFIRDPFNFFTVALGVGVRVELDVFNKLALLEQADAETRIRRAQADLVGQLVDFEVRKLNTEISAGYLRIEKLERANRTARGWLTASSLAYDIGTGEADELIDSFLAWAASEAELQTTRFSVLSKLVEMSRATGRLVGPHAKDDAAP